MAITLEELVVKLEAQNKEFNQQMISSQTQLLKSTEAMGAAVKAFADKGSKETGFFQTAMATMAGFVGGQAVIGAFNTLKDTLKDLFVGSIQGSMAQADSLNSLNQALAGAGQYSKEASARMSEFASELQRTTKFEDDAILKSAAFIESLGNLDEQGLKRATQAAVDLSVIMKGDLEGATRMVGKAAAGEVASFSKLGFAIQEGATRAETFDNAMKKIEDRLGGRAAAEAKSFSGTLVKLQNSFGDLQESMGDVVTQNLAIINVMAKVQEMITGQTGSIDKNKEAWKTFVGDALTYMIAFVQGPLKIFDDAGIAIDKLAYKITNAFNSDAPPFVPQQTGLHALVTSLEELGVASALGTQQMAAGMQATVEPTNSAKTAQNELADAQRERIEEGRELALQEIEGMTEDSAVRTELRDAELLDGLTKIQEAEAAKLLTKEQANAGMSALATKFHNEDLKRAEDKKKKEDEIYAKTMQGYSTFLGGMSALAQSGSKEVAAIGKAAAIANATMNAYVAIQNALANVPYPANIAAAIGIGVQAFANVANISGVKLKDGMTEVPGIGSQDNFPAILAPRERVVDAGTNADLKTAIAMILNGGGGGGGNMYVEIGLKDGLIDLIEAKLMERRSLNYGRGI